MSCPIGRYSRFPKCYLSKVCFHLIPSLGKKEIGGGPHPVQVYNSIAFAIDSSPSFHSAIFSSNSKFRPSRGEGCLGRSPSLAVKFWNLATSNTRLALLAPFLTHPPLFHFRFHASSTLITMSPVRGNTTRRQKINAACEKQGSRRSSRFERPRHLPPAASASSTLGYLCASTIHSWERDGVFSQASKHSHFCIKTLRFFPQTNANRNERCPSFQPGKRPENAYRYYPAMPIP